MGPPSLALIIHQMNINTTNRGSLVQFPLNGDLFEIHRAADLSNLYVVKTAGEAVALGVWTSPRNEFAISSNSSVHLPYDLLLKQLREANTVYMESIKS